MSDYEQINVVPTLHRNVINFMGMHKRDNYIASKRFKDRFIALDCYNMITTWNIITGKIET